MYFFLNSSSLKIIPADNTWQHNQPLCPIDDDDDDDIYRNLLSNKLHLSTFLFPVPTNIFISEKDVLFVSFIVYSS